MMADVSVARERRIGSESGKVIEFSRSWQRETRNTSSSKVNRRKVIDVEIIRHVAQEKNGKQG